LVISKISSFFDWLDVVGFGAEKDGSGDRYPPLGLPTPLLLGPTCRELP
jgi:hypothetical protein